MAKPILHRRDHEHGGSDVVRILWESDGAGGTGNAVLFDTFPQDADYLAFDTQSGIAMTNHDDEPIGIQQLGNSSLHIENAGTGQLNLESSGTGGIFIQCSSSGDLIIGIGSGNLIFQGLPTTDPGVSGAAWIDSSGYLRVS